jgi:hypothetical protein
MCILHHYLEMALDYQIKKEGTTLIETAYFIKFIYCCFIVAIIGYFILKPLLK